MRTIVFVRRQPNPRMYNQAYALKQSKKYRSILLCKTFDPYNFRVFSEIFDEIVCYQPIDLQKNGLHQDIESSPKLHFIKYIVSSYIDPWIENISELIRLPSIMRHLKADAYNCPGGPYEITQRVIKNATCPVVLDLHNGSISKGIKNLSKMKYEIDKYNFEHVSGIIHRGAKFETDYYKNHGYNIACPMFIYQDYCNKEFFVDDDVKKLSYEDGEYHIVNMGGGFSTPHIFPTLKKLGKQKIHFHLYLVQHSIISPVIFRKYIAFNETEPHFHLEKAVPFDMVHKEISKYDFGSMVYTPEYIDQFQPKYLKIATAYRIFTYLEAGLPIIISERLEYIKNMVEENKIGFSVKDGEFVNLHNLITSYDYEKLRRNVFKFREKLSIDKNVKQVVKIYETVIRNAIS